MYNVYIQGRSSGLALVDGVATLSGLVRLFVNKEDSIVNNAAATITTTFSVLIHIPFHLNIITYLASCESSHITIVTDIRTNIRLAIIDFINADLCQLFIENVKDKPFDAQHHEICYPLFPTRIIRVDDTQSVSLIDGGVELPLCPVCVLRLDNSLTGIISSFQRCQHDDQCTCLVPWDQVLCSVCQYFNKGNDDSDNENNIDNSITTTSTTSNTCDVCHKKFSIWICLICSFCGCGRYDSAHAHEHYLVSGHRHSLELASQRIWDYKLDTYVHSLMNNNNNILSLSQNPLNYRQHSAEKLKLKQLVNNYEVLLSRQLCEQRSYYESQLRKTEDDCKRQVNKYESMIQNVNNEQEIQLLSLLKCREDGENRLSYIQNQINKYMEDYHVLNTLNQTLVQKQQALQQHRNNEINELQLQIRDLEFFLNEKNNIKNLSDGETMLVNVPLTTMEKNKKEKEKEKRRPTITQQQH